MGWVQDLLAGYAHGSNMKGQARIEKKIEDLSKEVKAISQSQASKGGTSSGKTETISQSPSGHIRIDRTPDGVRWELIKDLKSNVIVSVKKLDK